MAAFACFSNSKEKTTDSYKALIERFRKDTEHELGGTTLHLVTTATFAYFSAHKGKTFHVYKDFVYELRKAELNVFCIILCDENPCPQFKRFIRLIEKVKLRDGRHSNAYYGEIKKIVTGFLNYFTFIIDDVVRKVDLYSHVLDHDQLLKLIERTEEIFETNQDSFVKDFLPIRSAKEQEKFDEIAEKHDIYMDQLKKMRQTWESSRHVKIDAFAKEQSELSLKKTNELCTFVHTYISVMLADRLYEIGVSVRETVNRMNNNKRQYKEECDIKVNSLINKLYEKNKEKLNIFRRQKKRSVDTVEINRTIDVLRDKIEHYGNEETMARLELETRYWMIRMRDFNEIAKVVTTIRFELENIEVAEAKYQTLTTTELPGCKAICFATIKENFVKRKKYLEDKLLHTSKALVTFFCVRGTDRILYTNNTGSYYCDEFNHQNYITDFGTKFFHVNCYGDFLENKETDPYYFDQNGRYIIKDGEKFHQCAPCTSQYQLGENGQFEKITKDCGHSEKINAKCKLEFKDQTDVEILPTRDILDISSTLDTDTVKYLWDHFGMILPEVLYDLAMVRPNNPIHYMAHILLKRRLEATNAKIRYWRKMAEKYRAKIYKERKDKAAAEALAWRSQFVKRPKPEDFDDSMEWAAYNQQVADWQFINSLGYYN